LRIIASPRRGGRGGKASPRKGIRYDRYVTPSADLTFIGISEKALRRSIKRSAGKKASPLRYNFIRSAKSPAKSPRRTKKS
jgi:hypothetical protein